MNDKEWQLVPREPTNAMLHEATWAYEQKMGGRRLPDGDGYDFEVVSAMFAAMLAHAPQPPEPGHEQATAVQPLVLQMAGEDGEEGQRTPVPRVHEDAAQGGEQGGQPAGIAGRLSGEREAFDATYPAVGSREYVALTRAERAFAWGVWQNAWQARAAAGSDEGAGTPSSRWHAAGETDLHGTRYDCERAALAMGDWTDDELANAVYMHGADPLNVDAVMRGQPTGHQYLEAAKDRIRWLSRKLNAALRPDPLREVCREVAGELQTWLDNYDPEGFGCACTPTRTCGTCQWRERQRPLIVLADKLRAALSRAGERT